MEYMREYELHWLDGKVEIVHGLSKLDAFKRSGYEYGDGAIMALDFVKKVTLKIITKEKGE
jgi:hypothetical protein